MQRWHFIVLAAVVVAGGAYGWTHREQLGLTRTESTDSTEVRDTGDSQWVVPRASSITWQKVDRASDGFRIEMPADVKQIQIPAFNETGGTEPVQMIFSNPDAETQFAVTWADNPPVMREGKSDPGRTLELARSGAVARTQTSLVSDSAVKMQGFPGREFISQNSGGGVLNSRFVFVGSRLYMLTAVFPSMEARRERDVKRFFNSFVVTSASAGTKPGGQSS